MVVDPDTSADHGPVATVVVPAYNAEAEITATVGQLRDRLADTYKDRGFEIIVVNDGSTDATERLAREAGARVVTLPKNKGKGAALRAGFAAATGEQVAFTDADLAYGADAVLEVLELLHKGAPCVVGSRHLGAETPRHSSPVRRIGNHIVAGLARTTLSLGISDPQCGLKGFRADVASALALVTDLDGFSVDMEFVVAMQAMGIVPLEIPARLTESEVETASTVRLATDVPALLLDICRILMKKRRRHYVSRLSTSRIRWRRPRPAPEASHASPHHQAEKP